MAWGPTLTALAFSALMAVLAFCFVTVPYLVLGPFTYSVFSTPVHVGPVAAFFGCFFFRYWRLLVNTVAHWLYRPAPCQSPPKYTNQDVTVVCPTVEPYGDIFRECCESVCIQEPRNFFVCVGHKNMIDAAEAVCAGLRIRWPKINIRVEAAPAAGKRIQIDHVAPLIDTAITICVDDHVFWPIHGRFFPSVLAAFEDDNIRLVGTSKRVRIQNGQGPWKLFWNMIGSLYLVRHNFEIMASNYIDGGVFVISGRTFALRSDILKDADFHNHYITEMIGFMGMEWGPLGPDDDNFITRWIYEHGFGIRVQASEDSEIETTLGWFPKHLSTCSRWARTTFRSNPRVLAMPRIWATQPWSIYAVYITGMINFALFWDALLCYMYQQLPWAHGWADVRVMVVFIMATKLVKTWDHFRRFPSHLLMFPGYVAFAYYHSLIKLYALVTIWDCAWTGRNIEELAAKAATVSGAKTYGTTGTS